MVNNQNKDLVSDDIQLDSDTFTVPCNSAELTMDIKSGKKPPFFKKKKNFFFREKNATRMDLNFLFW